MIHHRFALLAAVLLAIGCRPLAQPSSASDPSPVLRVYSSATGRPMAFDAFAREVAAADVVFFGEQHDDPVTHAAELALLAAIGAVRPNLVLSLEMFERDVQGPLDDYLAGRTDESAFLSIARPWERYATDYRGMVELARVRGWPVVASNVPRRIAAVVSRAGLTALDTIPTADRRWIARDHQCPRDDEYFTRFAEQMRGHGSGGPADAPDTEAMRAMTVRFYEAQCVKDEAMGEAVADALARAGRGAIVVHYDGAFHSDYGLGTAARLRRRAPAARTVVVSAIPVASLDQVDLAAHRRRGDYIVFTRRLAAPATGR
ncbi:MAG: ChaN family lipoprotein [Gemmatimonadaceae bacterium]|nr:ChaN family lipoprotein [Gemmatimonadaceae bacterium]